MFIFLNIKAEGRRQKAEGKKEEKGKGRRKAEGRRQKAEGRGQKGRKKKRVKAEER